jgi:dihydrofolate reductase
MQIAIHVAVAENGVIGRGGGMPWSLKSDLQRFKAETMGKPIIMGRRTWESIGRPLPGRLNIVITSDSDYRAEGAETVHSLEAALELAKSRLRSMDGVDEVCIIGGGEIYRQALPIADRLHVAHVLEAVVGDTHFPPIDPQVWELVSEEHVPAGEKDSHATRRSIYRRREPTR